MSKQNNSISIVIPVYNEERILSRVIHKVVNNLDKMGLSYEILLVENGSTDNSLKICRELEKKFKSILTLHLDERNYGDALRHGFLAAKNRLLVNFSVDWVDFDFLSNAINKSSMYDIVLSSKNMLRNLDKRSVGRVWGGRIFHQLSNMVVQMPYSDAHGIRLLKRRKTIELLRQCRMGGEMFEAEMLIRSHYKGLRVLEVPIIVKEFRPPRVSIIKRGAMGVIQLFQLKRILNQERVYGRKAR